MWPLHDLNIFKSYSYKIFMFKCIGCDFETFLYKIHVPLVAHAIMGLSGILWWHMDKRHVELKHIETWQKFQVET
jgi:hypothetical protein